MSNKKATKRALLTSITALVMCVVMLAGTTFAWFTDTASTSVNKIQAGTLKVGLEMKDANDAWVDAEGTTLNFKKAADGSSQTVLWEPGCTYELPAIRVVNEGNLAFKYKLVVTGAVGDTKLLDAIDFTVNDVTLTDMEGIIIPKGMTPADADKEKVQYSDANGITIKGHMKENAGNEYQGLSVSGIAVTVYAEQYTYEYDSYSKMYDEMAEGIKTSSPFSNYVNVTANKATNAETILTDNETAPTITATIPQGSTTATSLTLIKEPTANPDSVKVETGDSALTTDVKIIDTTTKNVISAEDGKYFTIGIQLGQVDLKEFYHKGVKLTKVDNESGLTSSGLYWYDFESGIVTFTTDSFSTFTAVYKFAGGNGTEQHPYLVATADQAMAMPGETGTKYFKLLDDIVIDKTIAFAPEEASNYTLDLNGKTIKNDTDIWGGSSKNDWSLISARENAKLTITGNGTLKAMENDCYAMDAYDSNSSITIENGTFIGNISAIYIYQGEVTINGGSFSIQQLDKDENNGYRATLNCVDKFYTDGTAKFVVSGGTFKNYNPSNSTAEIPAANFVATGYKVVSETQTNNETWYTVVPNSN